MSEKLFNWREDIEQLIQYKNFKEYTAIQKQAIPYILKGRDVIGISATGTGKSHAFILPILQKIDVSKAQIQAIIAAPTRELARQLYNMTAEINRFNPDIRVKLISSGTDKNRSIENLNTMPHIVVGTVGRLKDLFVDEAVLRLDQAKIIVIDEADMTLELGFLDTIDQICDRLSDNIQKVVFSATVPAQLQAFLRKYMNNPMLIEANRDKENQPDIRHVLINCRHLSYQEKLLRMLPGIQPYVCIIFAKTKQEVIETASLLKENGYSVTEMHSDLTSRERKQNLKRISNNEAVYVICSDIMARGLDIEGVSHVISLGLPSTLSYYTHRSGRTARAGRSGTSYLLYNQNDINGLKTLRSQGFNFEYEDYRGNKWVKAKAFDFKPTKKKTEADEAIAKIVNKPVKKVKPGYKKKRQEEIDAIRRRERRLMIRESIKQQKKERAKKAQREKGGY